MKHRSVCCYVIATLITLPISARHATSAGDGSPVATAHEWSLRECCDYAIEHSISIQQRQNQCRQQEIQLSTARNSRLPDLSGSVSQNFSFGRGLTAENTYSNTNTSSTSFQLGTSVPLFTGFQIPNQIKLSQLNLEAATQDLEKAKDDIQMQVAQAYVQILYDMEMADVAHRQITIDSAQVARLQAFVHNGKASEAELSQQRATLANSRLTATQADNRARLSLLTLTQLLELPTPDGFTIVRPALSEESGFAVATTGAFPSPAAIYAEALGLKPEIAAQQLRLQAADRNIKVAQAGFYPTLSLSGGLGTNYYTTSGFKSDGFGSQLKNNFSQYIGLNLNIPIFNRFQTRNSIRTARIELENQQLQLDNTKKTLYKEIQQVYYNARNAHAKAQSSLEALDSSKDAFTLMQAKYENGKATITEFNESKNNYLKCESDLVQARYELLYQTALIDFYRGRPLNF
jgi:outer membrane protein